MVLSAGAHQARCPGRTSRFCFADGATGKVYDNLRGIRPQYRAGFTVMERLPSRRDVVTRCAGGEVTTGSGLWINDGPGSFAYAQISPPTVVWWRPPGREVRFWNGQVG